MTEDTVAIEVDKGVRMTFSRSAIARTLTVHEEREEDEVTSVDEEAEEEDFEEYEEEYEEEEGEEEPEGEEESEPPPSGKGKKGR